MRRMRRIGWAVSSVFVLLILSAAAPSLKKRDVKGTLDEVFAYHVEYHELSPMIARRSLKVYLEQFDHIKMYLTAKEVRKALDLNSSQVSSFIANYQSQDYSDFAVLNQLIESAIVRAKAYRREIEKEIALSDEEPLLILHEPYSGYAADEKELKQRIYAQLLQLLAAEKSNGRARAWNAAQKKKLFDFWERRFARHEKAYLSSNPMAEHYLYLHILKAVSKSLDAHTTYFSPEEAYEMRTSLEKQFEGIGVVLKESMDGVVIHNMVKGGPAERSGKVQSGDLLVEVDGKSLEGTSYDEVLKKLQGSGNSRIQIGLQRDPDQEAPVVYRVDLKRERIVMQDDRVSYTYEPFEGGVIAKITLPSFYEAGSGLSCEQDLKEALRAVRKHGDLKGVVVDMRENSGGFLTQAVKVSGLFMSSGVVVMSKYAHGMTQFLRELDGKSFYSGPLVLLTSRASASAAEIVAQALQDYGLAVIVGDDRTYGKGTIQYQTVTDPRATNFFKVTIGRYYTVSGRTTQIDGVKADIITPTLYSAFPIGERYLEYSLKGDRIPSAFHDSLGDVDPRHKAWFQQNYLPNLQKQLSLWTQALPQLRQQSTARLRKNEAYNQFLRELAQIKTSSFRFPLHVDTEDYQMQEAVNILQDMHHLKAK